MEAVAAHHDATPAILAALLGNRRDYGDGDCVGPLVNAAADGINHNINNASVGINHNINSALAALTGQLTQGFNGQDMVALMSKLGDIEGAIPLVGSQVQIAISEAQNALTSRICDGHANINKNIQDTALAQMAQFAATRELVQANSTANLIATKDAQYALAKAIDADGDKTRALITSNTILDLQRQLGVAQAESVEERGRGRMREVEVSVSQNVSQAQAQVQQQQQLASLYSALSNLANDLQLVKQGQTIFNSGVMAASGTQAAANTRVN